MKLKLGTMIVVIGASGVASLAVITKLHTDGDTMNDPQCANVRVIADASNPDEHDAVYTSVRVFDTQAEGMRSGDDIFGWVQP